MSRVIRNRTEKREWRRRLVREVGFAALASCLLLGGCGVISIGITNSPDWCPNPKSTAPCP